jgi:cytochrome c-type biogenesis protein CcmH
MPKSSDSRPMARRTALALLIGTPFAWAAAPLAAQGSVEGISSQLICQCGCYKLLNVCEMDTALQMRSIISDKLSQGWDSKRIITYMTDTYGEQVLAAPTKRGFNLTVWITPFAAILAGAALIWVVVGAWVRTRAAQVDGLDGEALSELEARYGALLDQELDSSEG